VNIVYYIKVLHKCINCLNRFPICFHSWTMARCPSRCRVNPTPLMNDGTAGWPFIHWNGILLRIHFFSRHQLPFINAGRVGCSIPPIPGRDFFNDSTLRPAPVLAIYPNGSLCHQSYEINRPDLPLCIGFDHAIHLVFLLILTRTNSFFNAFINSNLLPYAG
jgi:hypothetical protein